MDGYYVLVPLLIAILAIIFVAIYNRLVQLRERCNDAWSQIDIQLKRRNDLIPNLVAAVQAYARFEKKVFQGIAEARAGAANAKSVRETDEANERVRIALKNLFAVVENYPALKANQNFLHLQDELSDAEERIAYSRNFYNDTALNYNNSIAILPWSIVAAAAGMQPREYFGATEAEKKALKVPDMNK